MNKNNKILLIIAVLTVSAVYSFLFPKIKYEGKSAIPQLDIPFTIADWQGKDVSDQINKQDLKYNFISDVFARVYANPKEEYIRFLILDAGNFHHPKNCFEGLGYSTKDLSDLELTPSSGKTLKAHALYTEKGNEKYILIYWICIDKKVTEWSGQKVKELYYSLFNKKKTGLMVRLDIPVQNDSLENTMALGKYFIEDLGQMLSTEQADDLFGK